jgi:hypothetical protein
MFISCDNKGCFDLTEAKLNKDTDEVICMSCGKSISSVTFFMKVTLKTLGQITRSGKKGSSFSIKCEKCNTNNTPKVIKGKIYCSNEKCNKEMTNVSPIMANTLKLMLSNKKD